MQTLSIEVSKIHLDPNQPRDIYTGIEGLADSMRNAGFEPDQAISVWQPEGQELPEGEYMVIDGHRRTKAAKFAGLESIPCFIFDGISGKDVWEKQLITNANREDLSPMNRVKSFQRSIDEHGMSISRVAKINGLSVATIKADLELSNLAKDLHVLVDSGDLSKEVARKLATSFEGENQQMSVFNNHLEGKKSSMQLSAIEGYLNKQAQTDIFSTAKKDAAENGGLSKARKASMKLENAINCYSGFIGDKNVLNARKRETAQIQETVNLMKKIQEKLQEDLNAWAARKDINKPKQDVAVNE